MKNKNPLERIERQEITARIIYIIVCFLVSWMVISTTVQRFKCPSMTETELFINIPQSFICDWKECN